MPITDTSQINLVGWTFDADDLLMRWTPEFEGEYPTTAQYEEDLNRLIDWAAANNVCLGEGGRGDSPALMRDQVLRRDSGGLGDFHIYDAIPLLPRQPHYTSALTFDGNGSTCRFGCRPGLFESCGHQYTGLGCRECGVRSPALWFDGRVYVCEGCTRWCTDCEDQPAMYRQDTCEGCEEQYSDCENCSNRCYNDDMYYMSGYGSVCGSCWEFVCPSCEGNFVDYRGDQCSECSPSEDDDYDPPVGGSEEVYDAEIDLPGTVEIGFAPRLFSEMRGEQVTSVEFEFTGSPNTIARQLGAAGLSSYNDIQSYHRGGSASRTNHAYVELDASVGGGGEMIASRLSLPEERATLRLWAILNVLRNGVKQGSHGLSRACGLHIHVDASRLGLDDVMSTAVAFNYLEDVLFRIGAAHWSRHRTQGGNNYTKANPKSWDRGRFQYVFGDRYLGLNIGNWTYGRQRCECSARQSGDASNCRCNVGKCTLEFRLWNATANPIKVHAYVALSQALVAWGQGRSESPDMMEAMGFGYGEVQGTPQDYAERLVWLFQNLPLSADERNSIRYCIRNSSLASILTDGVSSGDLDAALVQGLLHEDELIDVPEYIPARRDEEPVVEEAPVYDPVFEPVRPALITLRLPDRDNPDSCHYRDGMGNGCLSDLCTFEVYLDGSGRWRRTSNGRFVRIPTSQRREARNARDQWLLSRMANRINSTVQFAPFGA